MVATPPYPALSSVKEATAPPPWGLIVTEDLCQALSSNREIGAQSARLAHCPKSVQIVCPFQNIMMPCSRSPLDHSSKHMEKPAWTPSSPARPLRLLRPMVMHEPSAPEPPPVRKLN
jgi:hypothetical protein